MVFAIFAPDWMPIASSHLALTQADFMPFNLYGRGHQHASSESVFVRGICVLLLVVICTSGEDITNKLCTCTEQPCSQVLPIDNFLMYIEKPRSQVPPIDNLCTQSSLVPRSRPAFFICTQGEPAWERGYTQSMKPNVDISIHYTLTNGITESFLF